MGQLRLEGSTLSDEVQANGFALIDHGIQNAEVEGLVDAYAAFTDNHPNPSLDTMNRMIGDPNSLDSLDYSQDDQTKWHKYRTNHPLPAKPGGYTSRSFQVEALAAYGRDVITGDNAIVEDPKEFYHFQPNDPERIAAQHMALNWGSIPPEVHRLHERFRVIHSLASKAITRTLQALEETHPEIVSRLCSPSSLDKSPIRLLFYHPGSAEILAAGHYDKTFATIQLAESHIGLRVQDPATKEMQVVRRSPEKGVFFPAFTLPQLYPESPLKPGWHDVIKTGELNDSRVLKGRNCARWSIIFFTTSQDSRIPKKHETHVISSIAEAA